MFKNFKNIIKACICDYNYRNKLKKIKKYPEDKKIRVLFYVTENQKWGYQSLYEVLSGDDKFEVFVVVGILTDVHKGKDFTRKNLEENYQFFKSRNMNVEYGYKENQYVDLKEFEPDIVFYEQPWGLPKKHSPYNVSKYALTYSSPYSFQIFDYKDDYKQNFHRHLYKYLVTSDINISRFEGYQKGSSKNCLNINYLKLDNYFDNASALNTNWKDPQKIKIIYAPHHSFSNDSMNMATFRENGKLILDCAKSQSETTWIFKPHPQFKYALISNNIMSEKEIEEYYNEWSQIGVIYTQGDYFDIFKTSDLMITDCCSFLGEYFLTKKPIIRPVKRGSTPLNKLGQEIVKGYYETYDNEELLDTILRLLNNENDYKKAIREQIIESQSCFGERGSLKVYESIKNLIAR